MTKLIFSPRVNLLYKPTDDFQARLTYSTGFRAPQAYDEDLHVTAVGGEGVLIKLSDNLREERSNSYSGSVDWTAHLGPLAGKHSGGRFLYRPAPCLCARRYRQERSRGMLLRSAATENGARVYGANLDARIAHGKEAQFQLGFTAQRSRYTHEEAWTKVDGKDLTTKRMPRTPDLLRVLHFLFRTGKEF